MCVDITVRLCSPTISELAFPILPQCDVAAILITENTLCTVITKYTLSLPFTMIPFNNSIFFLQSEKSLVHIV